MGLRGGICFGGALYVDTFGRLRAPSRCGGGTLFEAKRLLGDLAVCVGVVVH